MDEYDSTMLRKRQIGLAWELGMKRETQSLAMKKTPDQLFRLRILSTNPGHHPAPRCTVHYVRHQASSLSPDACMKIG